jgi:hypothetical protein
MVARDALRHRARDGRSEGERMTQHALAFDSPPVPPVRNLAGLIRMESKADAEAYLAKHGDLWCIMRGLTLKLRPRKVGDEWLLCSWWSGHCWCLNQRRILQRVATKDIR